MGKEVQRIIPQKKYKNLPCSIVTIGCALDNLQRYLESKTAIRDDFVQREDGYLDLTGMNKYVRKYLRVEKKIYYKKVNRITLKEFLENNEKKAIVCVLGHYIYVNKNEYYSFFDNLYDLVVCIWLLKE